jgi:two-component system LytT family response regulator
MRSIIIDDNAKDSKYLEEILKDGGVEIEIIALCNSAKDGILAINKLKPDLVFLDIEMPYMNGLEMLQCIGKDNIDFNVVFTTSHNEYAVDAFEYSDLPYLLKPIERQKLLDSVNKAIKNKSTLYNQLDALENNLVNPEKIIIALSVLGGLECIHAGDIVYCSADGNCSNIHMKDGTKFLSTKPLKHLTGLLPTKTFFRIHQSYIINVFYLKSYKRGTLEVWLNKVRNPLPVAKGKKKVFEEFVDQEFN